MVITENRKRRLAQLGRRVYRAATTTTTSKEKIRIRIVVGKEKIEDQQHTFRFHIHCLVINVDTSDETLLGRPHDHHMVPSTYHQCI